MFDLENCGIPAVLAEEPSPEVTKRYTFIPTRQVVADIRTMGWLPFFAKGNTRPGKVSARHMIRFRSKENMEMMVGGVIPELVVTNSHDGLSSFALQCGLFRVVCGNGMVVSHTMFQTIRIRHLNYSYEKIREAVFKYIERIPQITEKVKILQAIDLDNTLKMTFARMAVALRFEGNPKATEMVDLGKLLTPVRPEDQGNDVWRTLNVLQEKLINGSFEVHPKNRRARPIHNISRLIKINQRLFDLADATAQLA